MPAVPALVSLAGTVGSAALSARAQSKAQRAQERALGNVRPVNIAEVSEQARAADLARYRDQFSALADVDPTTGKIRAGADEALLSNLFGDPNAENANRLLGTLFTENFQIDPRDAAFQQNLKAEAARQLSLGGELSPEAQAELVRAGLENTGAAGFNAGSSAARQSIGKLLASESEALAARRADMAKNLFGFATDLATNRNNQLLSIAGQSSNTSAAEQGKLLNLANLADSRVPSIGLSGGDIANLAIANTNQANSVAQQRGAVEAANIGARGQILQGLVGGLAAVPGNIAAANASAAQTRLINGLLNPTARTPIPTYNTPQGESVLLPEVNVGTSPISRIRNTLLRR